MSKKDFEEKNKSGVSFRTSVRGFNKEDVIQYIAEENHRFEKEKSSFEKRIASAERKSEENEHKLFDTQYSLDLLIKEKENEIALKDAKLSEKDLEITELNEKLAESNKKLDSTLLENARLSSLLDKSGGKVKEYADNISIFEDSAEAKYPGAYDGTSRSHELLAEITDLKSKYANLQEEYNSLLEKYKSQSESQNENTPAEKNESVDEISGKAIETIKAINTDVKEYMDSCVGEFDSYAKDVTGAITDLLEEITLRCRELDNKINKHKNEAYTSIDMKYDGFNS